MDQHELDSLLGYGTYLPVRLVLARQSRELLERSRSFIRRLQTQIGTSAAVTSEMREALAIGWHLLEDDNVSTLALISAQRAVSRAWKAQRTHDQSEPTVSGEPDSKLYRAARAMATELSNICDSRVREAEGAVRLLKSSLSELASEDDVIDKHSLPKQRKVFLSYAREDAEVVQTVERRLRAAGVETWLDEEALGAGAAVPLEIASAIRGCTHFLLFHSIHSRRSAWVTRETSLALSQEVAHGAPVIVPVLLDRSPLPDHIVDRNGLLFAEFNEGMAKLWPALGVLQRALWSISTIYRLVRKTEGLIETINWCRQADSFMTAADDTFEELEEAEAYVLSLALDPVHASHPRFIRSGMIYFSDGRATPSFDDDMYSYELCYFAGVPLLDALAGVSKRLAQSALDGNDCRPTPD